MMFRRLFQAVDHPPRQHRKVSGVDRQAHRRERSERPVEQKVTGTKQPTFFPLNPLGVHDIEPLPLFVEEHGDRLWRILQVAVHDHHEIARHVIERRRNRNLVPEVARQRNRHDSRILRGCVRQHLEGPIPAPIVDKHELVWPTRNVIQRSTQPSEQFGQHLLLVEHRHRDRYARCRRHDRTRPLKYTMCHNGTPQPVR